MTYLCVPLYGAKEGFTKVSESSRHLIDGCRWYMAVNGYAVNARGRLMHRVITGATKSHIHVDHLNFDRLDNRCENLRICSQQENNNRSRKRKTPWPYKGIRKQGHRWFARIGGRHIGTYATAEEAAAAYDVSARVLYGQYAVCNFGE